MADINGVKFTVNGSPTVYHTVTYEKSRPNNNYMIYDFTIKTTLKYSESWIGTGDGYGLIAKITVNGVSNSAVMKSEKTKWTGTGTHTTKISLKCKSTKGNNTQNVKFEVKSTGTLKAGTMSNSSYTVKSSALKHTDCTAPTTFKVSPNPFENEISLSWSGAKNGTNNSIKQYRIRYAISSNGSSWGSYSELVTIDDSKSSYKISMADKVSRGKYVKFAIRAEGTAGSSYYSSWKYSSAIRRIAYTKCKMSSINWTPFSYFEDEISLSWSAKGGTNNSIVGYDIEYAVLDKTGGAITKWSKLKSIASTKSKGSLKISMANKVLRKKYLVIRIRAKGVAGSSYYSDWVTTSYIQRNPYSICEPPTSITLKAIDINSSFCTDYFEETLIVSWSGAKAGDNNPIAGYKLTIVDIDNGITIKELSVSTTSVSGSTTVILDNAIRGHRITVHIQTIGSVSQTIGSQTFRYDSIPRPYNGSIKRIADINKIKSFEVVDMPTLEYTNGENINLKWDDSNNDDNTINHYEIQVAVGKKSDVIDDKDFLEMWGYNTPVLSNSAKIVWTDLMLNTSEDENAIIFTDNTITPPRTQVVLKGQSTQHIVRPSNSYYAQVENNTNVTDNSLIQFRIRPMNIFGKTRTDNGDDIYIYSPIITRYDMTGVAIGINDKWVNCQIYVGTNGKWVEQSVSAGINNSWINTDTGV